MATVKTTDTSKCFLGSCSVVIVVLGFEDMLKVAVISVLTERLSKLGKRSKSATMFIKTAGVDGREREQKGSI